MLVLVQSTFFLSVAKIFYLADLSISFAEFSHGRSSSYSCNFLDIAGTKFFSNLIFPFPFSSIHFHPFPFFLILLIKKKACWVSTEGLGNGGVVGRSASAGVYLFSPETQTSFLFSCRVGIKQSDISKRQRT